MNTNKIFMAFLCIILFFSACNSKSKSESRPELISAAGNAMMFTVENIILPKPRPELVFTTESVLLSEPDKIFSRKDDMELASVDGVTYAFEKTIPLDDRMDCIEKTQAILDKTGLEKEIHIYVYTNNTYDSTYITDGTIYTSVQSWNSPEYVSRILLGLFGEYCNYGAIYGYATLLCGQRNSTAVDKQEAVSQASMKARAQALLAICTRVKNEFVWKSEADCSALDLNILCFDEAFVSQREKENVMGIAANFVSDYITAHGTDKFHELLLNSGTVEGAAFFGEALAHFYSENNIDYIPSNILYTFGGHSYDYIARCRYATFFIRDDWYDKNYERNPLTYKNFLHQNYIDVKNFFEINSEQMGKYQELFGFEAYKNDLMVYFTNDKNMSQTSFYQKPIHSAYLLNVDSLMHEYIHSITMENYAFDANWSIEGLARYFSYKYDYYGIAMLNVEYNMPLTSEQSLYVREYKEKTGRDIINMEVDFTEIENVAVYSRSFFDPNCSYVAGSSFVAYLVSQFGEKGAIDMIFSEQGIEASLYKELVNNWKSYLKTNYSDFSKYK